MARARAKARVSAAPRAAAPPAAAGGTGRRAAPSAHGGLGPLALVAAAALAVYANSLGGALLYDDVNAIRDNPFVRTGDVAGILTEPSWWGVARGQLWRPLTTLTFALDHALHGLAPLGYHAVNVGLHAVVSVLALVVLAGATAAPRTALAAALLFATHPIHTEAVASVVGRAELLAAAGFLAAWWCWLRADRGAPAAWTAGAAVAYLLAMGGKENAVALPAALLVADLLARPAGEPLAGLARRRWRRYVGLGATALVFVVLRAAVLGRLTPAPDLLDNPLGALGPLPRVLTTVAVIGLYAWRLLVPLRLSADYSFDQIPAVTSPLDPGFLAGLAVLVGAPALAWWTRRRAPAIALGIGLAAVTFAVVANVFFLIGTIMGERLAYLPSLGFCLALAAGIARLARMPEGAADGTLAPSGPGAAGPRRAAEPGRARAPRARAVEWPLAFALPVAALVLLYGARTVARNAVWREPLGFFTTMVEDAPRSARSHRELGVVLGDLGRIDEARRAFERSLAIKPDDATTLYNYGNALGRAGAFAEAIARYERALAAKPDFASALENLGNAESARGDQQAALAAFRRALVLEPRSPILRMNLANTLFRAGAIAEARAEYERALALAPAAPEILTNYGSFLYAQGDFAAAAEVLARIPPPAPARALAVLGASQWALGRVAEARAVAARAERLYPGDPGVRQLAALVRRDAGSAP